MEDQVWGKVRTTMVSFYSLQGRTRTEEELQFSRTTYVGLVAGVVATRRGGRDRVDQISSGCLLLIMDNIPGSYTHSGDV